MLRPRLPSISLFELLLFVSALPIAVGFIAASIIAATYIEYQVLDEPMMPAHHVAAEWMFDSQSTIAELFFLTLMVSADRVLQWTGATTAVALFAFPRSRVSRLFAVLLLLSVPLIQIILESIAATHQGTLLAARIIANCVAMFVMCAFFLWICYLRPIRDSSEMSSKTPAKLAVWIVRATVIFATIVVSAYGWYFLDSLRMPG